MGKSPDRAGWSRGLLLVGALGVLLWGCSGDNIFTEPGVPGIDDLPTLLEILEPADGSGAPIGDSLLVTAHVQNPEGIRSVRYDGVAHRGDRELGTDEVVTRYLARTAELDPPATDTIVSRFVLFGDETLPEAVWIRVAAEDTEGRTVADSVQITVGGPRVQILDLEDGETIQSGRTLDIRVRATDPSGVTQVGLSLEGADVEFAPVEITPVEEEVTRVFQWDIPEDFTGEVTLRANALNTQNIPGQSSAIGLEISDDVTLDTTPPEVRIVVTPMGSPTDPNRLEFTDRIRIEVTGRDPGPSGVVRTGYSIRVSPRARPDEVLFHSDETTEAEPLSGTFTREFFIGPDDFDALDPNIVDLLATPDSLDLDLVGYMVDAVDNCGATSSADTPESRECVTLGGVTWGEDTEGQRHTVTVVSGITVSLLEEGVVGGEGNIADALVHRDNGWLILSNLDRNRLEVFDLRDPQPLGTVLVGSQPWGMTFDRTSDDIVYVANSGGTNISMVDLSAADVGAEVDRFSTPNVLLWDVNETEVQGRVNYERTGHDFSDRPQFLAHDSEGLFVFSTVPTPARPDGTVRLGQVGLGPDMATRIVTAHGEISDAENTWAVAGVDFLPTQSFDCDDIGFERPAIRGESHVPGDREDVRISDPFCGFGGTPSAVEDLRAELAGEGTPDLFLPRVNPGNWNVASVGLSDTTFIAHSTDRRAVLVGEGATQPTGRIFYWRAEQQSFTRFTTVADLTGNASERVMGVALNRDGLLGVGRGAEATYFFDPDLRLQGEVLPAPGGAGVALHPLHEGRPLDASQAVSLAFVPVGDAVVEIYGTRHFNLLGRAFIRDTMLGPVRALQPFADDNDGLTCVLDGGAVDPFAAGTDDACIVVKLAGPTAGGGVAVVDITAADVRRGPS